MNPAQEQASFETAISRVVDMPMDRDLRSRVQRKGMDVVNVMWEDTARTAGSCWGANISDMTLQVRCGKGGEERRLLPVIRHPNFADVSCDIKMDEILLKVGNQSGSEQRAVVSLRDYLENVGSYLSNREKYHVENTSLVTAKDTHVLGSAQACFLPVPARSGEHVTFNPVVFNYQSQPEDPAVLVILATPQGTSATVLNNRDDLASWGQNVYFNNNGQKAPLTGQRESAYLDEQAQAVARDRGISVEEARRSVSVEPDADMVMVIQVPLKHKERSYGYAGGNLETMYCMMCSLGEESADGVALRSGGESDVEKAVIDHGEDEGAHLELGGYKLERDDRFPVRVTFQFWSATSNGVVTDRDLDTILKPVRRVYEDGDFVGSLVKRTLVRGVLPDGASRPTEPAVDLGILAPPKGFRDFVNPLTPGMNASTGIDPATGQDVVRGE